MALLSEWIQESPYAVGDHLNEDDFRNEASVVTKREMEKLEDLLRDDLSLLQMTHYLQKEFIGIPGTNLKIHRPSLSRVAQTFFFPYLSLIWKPKEDIDDRVAKEYILRAYREPLTPTIKKLLFFLYHSVLIYSLVLLLGAFGFGDRPFYEDFYPLVAYFFAAAVYTAQVSIWYPGLSINRHKIPRLSTMSLIAIDRSGRPIVTSAAAVLDLLLYKVLLPVKLPRLKKSDTNVHSDAHSINEDKTSERTPMRRHSLGRATTTPKMKKGDTRYDLEPHQYNRRAWVVWVSVTLIVAIPFALLPSYFHMDVRSHAFLSTARTLLEVPMLMAMLGELGMTIYLGLYRRMKLLQLLGVMVSRKESRLTDFPIYFKLNTPENIIAFTEIRNYLKSYQSRRIGFLQVLLVFLTIAVGSSMVVMGVRVYRHVPFDSFDMRTLYVYVVLGLFVLSILAIGAAIDSTQRAHIALLVCQKWRLTSALQKIERPTHRITSFNTQHFDEEVGDELRSSSDLLPVANSISKRRSSIGSVDHADEQDIPSEEIDDEDDDLDWDAIHYQEEDKTDAVVEDEILNTPLRSTSVRNDTPKTPSINVPSTPLTFNVKNYAFPLTPVSLSKRVSNPSVNTCEESIRLLGELVAYLKKNDTPLTLFGIRVTFDLFVKITSLLVSALGGRLVAAYKN